MLSPFVNLFVQLFFLIFAIIINFIGPSEHAMITAIPSPSLRIYEGHISFFDAAKPFSGVIIPQKPYSIDIQMEKTESFDFVIENCSYNSYSSFIENNRCLSNGDIVVKKWETNDYSAIGSTKRTIIHFVTTHPIQSVECKVKVLEQSCERHPAIGIYRSHSVPLACCMNLPPPLPALPRWDALVPLTRPYNQDFSTNGHHFTNDFFPFWLWLLLLVLGFLLLLFLLICSICFFMTHRRRHKVAAANIKDSPPTSKRSKIFFVSDAASQTSPLPADKIRVDDHRTTNNKLDEHRQQWQWHNTGIPYGKSHSETKGGFPAAKKQRYEQETHFPSFATTADDPDHIPDYAVKTWEEYRMTEEITENQIPHKYENFTDERSSFSPAESGSRLQSPLYRQRNQTRTDEDHPLASDSARVVRYYPVLYEEGEDGWICHKSSEGVIHEERRIQQTTSSTV